MFVQNLKLTRPGLSSFKKIAPTGFLSCPSLPHFPPSARGRHPSFHASPISMLRRLHFATLYISGTGSFSDLRMHTTSNTDRYYLPCFFTPTGIINTPILTKNIQNAILSQPKKQQDCTKKFSYVSQLCSFICTYSPENPTLLSRNPDFTQTRENVIPYADRLLN